MNFFKHPRVKLLLGNPAKMRRVWTAMGAFLFLLGSGHGEMLRAADFLTVPSTYYLVRTVEWKWPGEENEAFRRYSRTVSTFPHGEKPGLVGIHTSWIEGSRAYAFWMTRVKVKTRQAGSAEFHCQLAFEKNDLPMDSTWDTLWVMPFHLFQGQTRRYQMALGSRVYRISFFFF